jgi:hypothetical protein
MAKSFYGFVAADLQSPESVAESADWKSAATLTDLDTPDRNL